MTGISYITNTEGERTQIVIDLKEHGELVKAVLEDLLDYEIAINDLNAETMPLSDAEALLDQDKD